MPDELIELGSKDGFTLFERKDRTTGDWKNLKLVFEGKAPKNNWWLAWNGQRLSDGRDRKILFEHNPEIEAWVILVLTASKPEAQLGAANP